MKVMIAGAFDPFHQGHLDHIQKAACLGDYLYVICHKDNAVIQKKGYCVQPFEIRRMVLQGILSILDINGTVLPALEDDMPTAKYSDGLVHTIQSIKPDIFAKGGDRIPGNLPPLEVEACKKVGCRIVYGIGDLLNSSSKMMEKARQ